MLNQTANTIFRRAVAPLSKSESFLFRAFSFAINIETGRHTPRHEEEVFCKWERHLAPGKLTGEKLVRYVLLFILNHQPTKRLSPAELDELDALQKEHLPEGHVARPQAIPLICKTPGWKAVAIKSADMLQSLGLNAEPTMENKARYYAALLCAGVRFDFDRRWSQKCQDLKKDKPLHAIVPEDWTAPVNKKDRDKTFALRDLWKEKKVSKIKKKWNSQPEKTETEIENERLKAENERLKAENEALKAKSKTIRNPSAYYLACLRKALGDKRKAKVQVVMADFAKYGFASYEEQKDFFRKYDFQFRKEDGKTFIEFTKEDLQK